MLNVVQMKKNKQKKQNEEFQWDLNFQSYKIATKSSKPISCR